MHQQLIERFADTLGQAQAMMEDIPCADCAEMRGGTKNPAWLIGHLVVAADFMNQLAGGDVKHEPWHDLYGPGSPPKPDRSLYATKAELMDALAERHETLSSRISGLSARQLAAELPHEGMRKYFPTITDAAAYMMIAHEMYHLGQLNMWRNAAGNR